MTMIHWCGTGLSSGPGLHRLIEAGHAVTVWTIDRDQARHLLAGRVARIADYTPEALDATVMPGAVVVSMLPPDLHAGLARIALRRRAHFVCSSYLSPELHTLDGAARAAGVSVIAEVGLDPGIDHLMAHDLVADFRASGQAQDDVRVSFHSYCGGIPARPNALRYKFSWSPLGVLRALRNPARTIRDYAEVTVDKPWQAVESYTAPLPTPEAFEVYPNRDSLGFVQDYGFDPGWKIRDFVRGTIRLPGWQAAWAEVFTAVDDRSPAGDRHLAELATRLWQENSYAPEEPDRVVLVVALSAADGQGRKLFDRSWVLDATGDARGTAMARLVSGTLSLAVEAVKAHRFAPGVHPAPADPVLVNDWLTALRPQAQYLEKRDHA